MQIFLLSGLLVFTDKVIAKEDSERIKRRINMTQVGRLYEEEKQEALRELERKLNNENRKKIQNLKKEHRHTLQKSKQEQRVHIPQELRIRSGGTERHSASN